MARGFAPGLLVIALFVPSVAVEAQDYLTPQFSSVDSGHLTESVPGDDFENGRLYNGEALPHSRVSGGMHVTPFVSLELGYRNFGRSGEGDVVADTNAWSLSGLLSLPLDSGLAPYARLGQMFWASAPILENVTNPDGTRDLYYGLGLRYGLAEQLNLHFEYERFGQNESEYDMSSMNLHLSF